MNAEKERFPRTQWTGAAITEWGGFLGWGAMDLARAAEISIETAYKAFRGEPLSNRIKQKICSALSDKIQENIQVGDIAWLDGKEPHGS